MGFGLNKMLVHGHSTENALLSGVVLQGFILNVVQVTLNAAAKRFW